MTSGVALQVGVLVSARVNDPRTAQQFGALFILPLTGLFMAQMSGAFVLTTGMGLLVLAGLAVVWFFLLLFGIADFRAGGDSDAVEVIGVVAVRSSRLNVGRASQP